MTERFGLFSNVVRALTATGLASTFLTACGPSPSELNNTMEARLSSCWNEEGMEEYVPTVFPTVELSPDEKAINATVQKDREQQIQGTQTAFLNSEEGTTIFDSMGEE